MTTAPSSLRFADSATTDSSPTGCPRRLAMEIKTEGLLGVIDAGLTRVITTGIEF